MLLEKSYKITLSTTRKAKNHSFLKDIERRFTSGEVEGEEKLLWCNMCEFILSREIL